MLANKILEHPTAGHHSLGQPKLNIAGKGKDVEELGQTSPGKEQKVIVKKAWNSSMFFF